MKVIGKTIIEELASGDSAIYAALNTHAIVSATDRAGTILFVNEKFCEISGYSSEELIGQNHRILKSDEHDEQFFVNVWQAISSGNVWQGEIKNRRKDGYFYWVETTIYPILDDNQKPLYYLSIRTDITRSKAAQLSTEDLYHKLRAAAEGADLVIIEENLTRQTGSFLISSDFDRGAQPMVGDERLKHVPNNYHRAIKESFEKPGQWVEYPLYLPTLPHPKWIQHRVLERYTRFGDEIVIILSFNITDRVERENSLRNTLLKNESLLDENQQLTRLLEEAVDRADLYLYQENLDTGEARVIYRGDDPFDKPLTGEDLLQHVPPEYHQIVRDSEESPGVVAEFPIMLDDRPKWVRHSVIERFEHEGQRLQFAMSMDITAVVEQREQLTELLSDKNQALADREKAFEELQDANRKRNQIYGMIAHELRTPVSAIAMMAGDDTDQEWLEHKQDVLQASRDLINTIDDMRMIVNPELDRPIRKEAFTLPDLTRSIVSAVGSIVASTRMEFAYRIDAESEIQEAQFSTDVYRVKAAVTNLIRNACLHSEGSSVRMEVQCERADTNQKTQLKFFIIDNGKGIPEKALATIFDPFVRSDSRAEGTGLGLHIARSWIQEIGGDLLYSRVDAETRFELFLPLDSVTPHEESAKPQTSTNEIDLSKLRVLMVDDEPMLRMVGKQLLSKLVAEVHMAEHGDEALKLLRENEIDLILTDYFMPVMDGVALTEHLRGQGDKRPIVGLSAATLGDQLQNLIDAGCSEVLPKPLTAQSFTDLVAGLHGRNLL